LSEPGLSNEEQQEYIKLIQISGARMLNLISEIIDIFESGMMEVKLEEVDVNREIDFVFDVLKLMPKKNRYNYCTTVSYCQIFI
jgi:signal transduction histidine kinase